MRHGSATDIRQVQLEGVRLAQAINYLEAYGLDIGLLINFGNTSLQFKRLMNPKK
jgi:GxxExxY protein